MKRIKTIICLTLVVAVTMISVGLVVQNKKNLKTINIKDIKEFNLKNIAASANMAVEETQETETKEEVDNPLLKELTPQIAPASILIVEKVFSEISVEEAQQALATGLLRMEYSAPYTMSSTRLTKSKGAQYFNNHRETYYSEKVLPGGSLAIPGRHVAEDGTIRDGDGFICVAADPGYMGRGSTLITSLGPAKVYDSGCAYGTIDIYVSW